MPKNVAFRLTDELVASLDAIAEEYETTRTAVVIQFLNEGIERLSEGATQVIRQQAITSEEVVDIIDPLLKSALSPILERLQVLEHLQKSSNLLSAVDFDGVSQQLVDYEGCNKERLEALNRAGTAEMLSNKNLFFFHQRMQRFNQSIFF